MTAGLRQTHEMWMRQAMRLAEKGRGGVSPNPLVGCVIVRGGKVVSNGYHRCYGGPHAEIHALRDAGRRAKGAALYVTLEPCSTWGKTPPCTDEIIRAGIGRVVVAALDPNPVHHGRGVGILRRSGIRVVCGVLRAEAEKQNEVFFKYIAEKIPFVTLKMAQSLDGKIAAVGGKSRWISSPPARSFVQRLRREHDAILIGTKTLCEDDPRLTARGARRGSEGPRTKPWRVVLDAEAKTPSRARVFSGRQLTILAVSEKKMARIGGKRDKDRTFSSKILLPVRETPRGLDLEDLLKKLGRFGVASVLVEGGGELAWSLLRGGLADRAYWIVAPKILGGRDAKTSVEGDGVPDPARAISCRVARATPLGRDWLFETEFEKRKG